MRTIMLLTFINLKMANIWFLSLLFLICILVLAAFKHKKQRNYEQPPSPPGFPIIGNLHQLGELPHQSLWRLSKKYGPVMLLKLGRVPTVVVSSSDAAKQALKVHDLHCCSRPGLAGPRELSYNYLDIAFSPFGDYFKEVRKLSVQELFSTKQVHSIQPIKDEEVKKLIDSITESASNKTPVNLNKTFLALTVSVICRAAFGVSFEGTVLNSDKFNKLVREALEMLGSFSASDFIPYVGWIIDCLTGLQARRVKSARDLDAFYEQMIDLHNNKQDKEKHSEDFVDLLLKLEKEEAVLGNDKLTRNHIKAILMNVLLVYTTNVSHIYEARQQHRKPPTPPGFPVIRNLHQLGELPHQSLWRLSKKYGPVMLLNLGKVPTLILSSSETARQALKDRDIHCCSRPHLAGPRDLSYNYRDIAFSPFNDYWKEVRKITVQELFSTKQVNSFQPIREEEVKKLIDSTAESAYLKTPVNLNKTFTALTVSVVCKAAFGVSFDGTVLSNEKFNKLIREAFEMLGSFAAIDFNRYIGWIIDWLTGLQGRRERSLRGLDAFYEQMIDLHKEVKEKRSEDFVDLLLRLEKEEVVLGNEKLTRTHIKAILMDILLGGIDTSAITMTWTMAELATNPRVMNKVQSEIRNQVENKSMVSLDDIDQLHYLKMVIKETWRLHPPLPLLSPREAISEFDINGYTIQPKTRLPVNVWAIGRDPDTWKDPEEFLP